MRIDWAVTCRYAESNGTQGTIVGAGTDLLYVMALPQPVGIMLAVRLVGEFEELEQGQSTHLKVEIRDPDGKPVRGADGSEAPPSTIELKPSEAKQLVSGWLATPFIALGLQWIASSEGPYTITVEIDGDDSNAKRTPVHVLLAPGAPAAN